MNRFQHLIPASSAPPTPAQPSGGNRFAHLIPKPSGKPEDLPDLGRNFGEDIAGAGATLAQGFAPGLLPTVGGMFEGARRSIAGAPGDLRSNVDAATEDIRQALTEASGKISPTAQLAGEVTGALLSPYNKIKLVKEGATALGTAVPRILNAGASGAAYGGAYAADKGEDVGSGARTGLLLGGGLGIAGAAVGRVVRSAPARAAGRAVIRLTGRSQKGVEGAASGDLVRSLGGTQRAEAAAARMEGDIAAGRPAMVGDASTGVQRLARLARNRSPEAADTLNDAVNTRQAGQIGRLEATVQRITPANATQTREGLKYAADIVNPPAYERAMQHPNAQSMWTRELEQLTIAPQVRQAIAEATKSAASEAALTGVRPFRNPFRAAPDGTLTMVPGVTPNLRFWDAVKQNLGEGFKNASPGEQRYVGKLGEKLRGILDEAVPDYAAARSQAASFLGAKDAIDAGAKFLKSRVSNTAMRSVLAKTTQADRDMFAEGLATRLRDEAKELGDTSQVSTLFKSPASRERIEIALGPNKARELETEMQWERTAARLRQSVQGGSSTNMEAWLGTGLAAGAAGGAGLYASGGNPLSLTTWLTALTTAALIRAGKARGANVDDALLRRIAEMLTSNDPATIRRAIQVVSRTPALRRVMQVLENNVSKAVVAGAQDGSSAVPQGARRARDGQWYIPDGSRQGRYLRVRQQ